MLGKGDVGRVYLVREKKTGKLYAMKGNCAKLNFLPLPLLSFFSRYPPFFLPLCGAIVTDLIDLIRSCSPLEARNDRTEKDQARLDRARNISNGQPPFHCDSTSLFPIGRLSLFLYGVLHGRGVLPRIAN